MTWGNCVAPRNVGRNFVPGPTSETPCNASDHHSYPWMPSLGTAAALLTNSLTFSCKVNRPNKSLTLSLIGRFTRQNGRSFVARLFGSQAKGALDSPLKKIEKPMTRRRKKDGERMHFVLGIETIFVWSVVWRKKVKSERVYIGWYKKVAYRGCVSFCVHDCIYTSAL